VKWVWRAGAVCLVYVNVCPSVVRAGGVPGYEREVGVSARPAGMGGAHVAVARDESSVLWNAAGLTRHDGFSFGAMHAMLSEGASAEGFAFAHRATDTFAYGGAVQRLCLGDIVARDMTGAPRETFAVETTMSRLAGAVRIVPRLRVGGVLGMWHFSEPGLSGTVPRARVSGDLGMVYFPQRSVTLGFTASHLGASSAERISGVRYEVPVRLVFGVAARIIPDSLLFAADVDYAVGQAVQARVGAEWVPWGAGFVALRAGVDQGMPSFGIGFRPVNPHIDYALQSTDLGPVHRVSLRWRFGTSASPAGVPSTDARIKTAVNVMKEIPIGMCHLFASRKIPVASVELENQAETPVTLVVEVALEPSAGRATRSVTLAAAERVTLPFTPVVPVHTLRSVRAMPTPGSVVCTVRQVGGEGIPELIRRDSFPVSLYPYDQFSPYVRDADGVRHELLEGLVSWVTFNDRVLQKVVSRAAERGSRLSPPVRMFGVQSADTGGLGGDSLNGVRRDRDYREQVRLIYEVLRDEYGVTYLNQPVVYRNSQRIKLPRETLHTKGNCIELAVLLAAVLESVEIDPVVVVLPEEEHAIVGWRVPDGLRDRYLFVDPAMFGAPFETLLAQAEYVLQRHALSPDERRELRFPPDGVYRGERSVVILDVRRIRRRVSPSPFVK